MISSNQPPKKDSHAGGDAPQGGDASPDATCGVGTTECPICLTSMYGVHCKQICPNCGYKEDCSDLFRA